MQYSTPPPSAEMIAFQKYPTGLKKCCRRKASIFQVLAEFRSTSLTGLITFLPVILAV
jgi:hypothetical protein